ncbi:hypothetical protein Gotri_014113 [Gossypium trilobum]|uniref:Uncharacterized protein n=1 Tax=Gossypium trilobum TaxID=34281 RepID=A0A7J9DW49_9ROSI|nr:hypothetical protein [Gossypium trilobum]
MSHQQRKILTPGICRKRKEREAFYSFKPSVPAVPMVGSLAEPRKVKTGTEPNGKKECPSYAEVASVLKGGGAHIPGIVNPTQLARWIQM